MYYFPLKKGSLNTRNNEVDEAILASYKAAEFVKLQRENDWKTILNLRLVILLSKLVGFGLITWGRNIDDWPTDVDLLNAVPTNYYLGITGRALQYGLFLLDDFRHRSELFRILPSLTRITLQRSPGVRGAKLWF